jgi:hypothetical protein
VKGLVGAGTTSDLPFRSSLPSESLVFERLAGPAKTPKVSLGAEAVRDFSRLSIASLEFPPAPFSVPFRKKNGGERAD